MNSSMPRLRLLAFAAIILGVIVAIHYWYVTGYYSENTSNSSEIVAVKLAFNTKPLPPLKGEQLSDRWVVVTTIQRPTEDMRLLGQMSKYGWRVLAVGDKSTPSNWVPPPGVRFLSAVEAETLGYNLLRYHKWKVYAAKNVGYMFAIQHGAKIIYDTDDDNHPTDMLRSMLDLAGVDFSGAKGSLPKNLTRSLYFVPAISKMPVINPLPHFGQSLLWPRGYPLREISRQPLRSYRLCNTRPPAWIQGVVNGDPDVDAIFRLTRKHYRTEINMTFDQAPPVMAPQGYYIQTNSQNTLFVQSAIPFIFLPYTVTMRETDIWRAYIGQRLLWMVGFRKGYVSPNAFQARNPHDYLKDFKDEMKLYVDVEDLVRTLSPWTCPSDYDIGTCFEMLYKDLSESKFSFVGKNDAYAVAAWVADLRRIGYPFPKRNVNPDCISVSSSWKGGESKVAHLYPIEQKTTIPAHSLLADAFGKSTLLVEEHAYQHNAHLNLLQECAKALPEGTVLPVTVPPSGFSIGNVTLLISLASLSKSVDVIAMLKRVNLIYRPFVPRMVFCTPKQFVTDEKVIAVSDEFGISLLESLRLNPGSSTPSRAEIAAECFGSVHEMRFNGEVFIYIAVDAYALLTPHGLEKLSRLKSNDDSNSKNNLAVGACANKSPLIVATTASALSQASDADILTKACTDEHDQLQSKACPSKPVTAAITADVLSGCLGIAEAASLSTQCSIFIAPVASSSEKQ